MNHEEKIFGMLEQLFVGQQEMKSDIQGMKSDIQGIKTEMQGMKADIQGMKAEMQQLNHRIAKIEEEHGKKLDALFDGYRLLSEKIDQLSKVKAQEEDMVIVKAAIKDLSQRVAELEKAI